MCSVTKDRFIPKPATWSWMALSRRWARLVQLLENFGKNLARESQLEFNGG